MTPKHEGSYLWVAALAAFGGIMSIATSMGIPVYQLLHGQRAHWEYSFFGIWGIFALCGAAANIYVYRLSLPPPDGPPRGGRPIAEIVPLDTRRTAEIADDARRAA